MFSNNGSTQGQVSAILFFYPVYLNDYDYILSQEQFVKPDRERMRFIKW